MKTLSTLSLAALMLVTAAAPSFAEEKKNTAQSQVAAANQQISIRLLRLRMKARQTPSFTLMINQ